MPQGAARPSDFFDKACDAHGDHGQHCEALSVSMHGGFLFQDSTVAF